MPASKIKFNRARPILGTFFEIKILVDDIKNELHINHQLTQVFEAASKLESIFSVFNKDSDISRLNQAEKDDQIRVTKVFFDLFQLALQIEDFSENSFSCLTTDQNPLETNPFIFTSAAAEFLIKKNTVKKIDLNGIAKGFIVDQIADEITRRLPDCSGIINAGGDLRFINELQREVFIRLGNPNFPLTQKLLSPVNSIATSSVSESKNNPHSKSFYPKTLRSTLDELSTVTVLSQTCAVADSLTKVALFAPNEVIQKCAQHFNTQILAFNSQGTLIESYGGL